MDDPIARALPVNMVQGSFVLRGDMYTGVREWMLLYDYKKEL
jgi:hypothetical protein